MTTRNEEIERRALERLVSSVERIAASMERIEFALTGIDHLPEHAYEALQRAMKGGSDD